MKYFTYLDKELCIYIYICHISWHAFQHLCLHELPASVLLVRLNEIIKLKMKWNATAIVYNSRHYPYKSVAVLSRRIWEIFIRITWQLFFQAISAICLILDNAHKSMRQIQVFVTVRMMQQLLMNNSIKAQIIITCMSLDMLA